MTLPATARPQNGEAAGLDNLLVGSRKQLNCCPISPAKHLEMPSIYCNASANILPICQVQPASIGEIDLLVVILFEYRQAAVYVAFP